MDRIIRGMAKDDKVRIVAIEANEAVKRICDSHETLPLTTVALGKTLLIGAMMGVLEKGNQGVMIQINSNGPIKSILVQADVYGRVRGYVLNPRGDLQLQEDNINLNSLIGDDGILSVTKVIDGEHDFKSDVILTASDINQDIAYYFFASEQIPTIVHLQVDLDDQGSVSSAKGYLIQLMTGYEEKDVDELENLVFTKIYDLEDTLKCLFPDFKNMEEIKVNNYCDCSKERFQKGLLTLSKEELEDLSKESIEVVCQFCSSKYEFTPEELEKLINQK